MKRTCKILSLLCSVAMIVLAIPFQGIVFAATVTEVPDGYTGIYTKADLDNIRLNMSGKYILMNDITFSDSDYIQGGDYYNSGKGWEPIGSLTSKFKGVFDGNGCTIYNLYINNPDDNGIGLFGYTEDANILNLAVRDVSAVGNYYVGAICGSATDTLFTSLSAGGKIEGNCYVAGICGLTSSKDDDQYITEFIYCVNAAKVVAKDYAAGITGKIASDAYRISDSHASAIKQCVNTGNVISENIGAGIAATHYNRPDISDCINCGEIDGPKSVGIIFDMPSVLEKMSIVNCYSFGKTTYGPILGVSPKSEFGMEFSPINCYYLDDDSTYTNPAGTPKSEDQLRKQSSFEGFDFTNVWTMDGTTGYLYPELKNTPMLFQLNANEEIIGTPVYGETLTADFDSITPAGTTYAIEWFVDGESVSTDDEYIVDMDSIGKTLQFKLSSTDSGACGHVFSEIVTMGKASQPQDVKPAEIITKTATSIKVAEESNQLYSLDGETWQESGVFENLTPNTEYTVYTYIPESAVYNASEIDSSLKVTTNKLQLTGTISAEGTKTYGHTLTADVSKLSPENATYTIEWRIGEKTLGTGNTYSLKASDIGTKITVIAIGKDNTTGEIASEQYSISACDINEATALAIEDQTYSQKGLSPAVVLKFNGMSLTSGTDFNLVYHNNTDAGTATVDAVGIGNFAGKKTISFTINPKNIAVLTMDNIEKQYYTGEAIEPLLSIYFGENKLIKGLDYTVQFFNNTDVGEGSVLVKGIGNYNGSFSKSFVIEKYSLKDALITLDKDGYFYTGKEIIPSATVFLGNKTLVEGTDYTVSYSNNILIGTAKAIYSGCGIYTGEQTVEYLIKSPIVVGDANDDGLIDMKDVLALRKFIAGIDVVVNVDNCDTDGDTYVNMKDVLTLRKYLANIIDRMGA